MTARRLTQGGSRIARDQHCTFSLDGKPYSGYVGDTLASALLAQDQLLLARSWKYHRARGVLSSGVEEPNALVQLESGARCVPNAKMTEVSLYDGLSATTINPWPDALSRLFSIHRRFARLFPAGFYYKTFMWPARAWMWYEERIRRAGGLGAAPDVADEDRYIHQNWHCETLIIGAGIAGLAQALQAASTGERVLLVELQPELGGSAHRLLGTIDHQSATDWVQQAQAQLAARPNVRILQRTVAFGLHEGRFATLRQALTDHLGIAQRQGFRERLWRVQAQRIVLATGAHERPMLFENNDLPGVMLSSALVDYAVLYGVLVGQRIVLLGNNDTVYADAIHLRKAGAQVTVVDARDDTHSGASKAARDAKVNLHFGFAATQALGGERIAAVQLHKLVGGKAVGHSLRLPCDALGMAGGWSPAVHLHSHLGGKVAWQEDRQCFVPLANQPYCLSVGAANGDFSLAGSLGDHRVSEVAQTPIAPVWLPATLTPISRRNKIFIDYQNDVSAADIQLAVREGFESIEHIKRYTAMGFGTDQGKTGNINGMVVAAKALGKAVPQVGTTTFRPNYIPISFGLFAGLDRGELFDPVRTSAIHDHHVASGCPFEDVGQWKRPWYFPEAGEDMPAALAREVRAVRTGVGLFDASTLGKIDIQGPDAATLLDWIYCNNWAKLGVGKCRYGLMLDENGMVFDDGVTARLGPEHFVMTTTTGGAARVLTWLERWVQTEWPSMRVFMTSVTDHWSTFALAGPNSRKVLQKLCQDVDLAASAFPFMSHCSGTVAGVRARLMRISFSGELSWEINVPSAQALPVWQALLAAGAEFGITRYGTETMHVLRAEKGYIIVGQDTDGSVTPDDLGMGAMLSKTKSFIGDRSLSRSDTLRPQRKQLVGLLLEDRRTVLEEGAQLTECSDIQGMATVPMIGHVTSSYQSPTLGRGIAMALVKNGRARMGQTVYAALAEGRCIPATVCSPVFYDEQGKRHHD